MSAPTTVLFDLDGTLVDTREAILASYRATFVQELGRPLPVELEDPHVLMAPRPLEIFADWAPEADPRHLVAAYGQHYVTTGHTLARPFDGIAEALAALSEAGARLGIVTNKARPRAVLDLEGVGLGAERFDCLVTAEDTVERKPHPAPVLHGATLMAVAPSSCWYVGDGPQDVVAGRAAGMRTAGAAYGYYGADALTPLAPDELLATPRDLVPELLGLSRVTR